MKVLIVFNHPAPYKVRIFNELSKYVDLTVLFERTKANDRPDEFYEKNDYSFNYLFLKDGYIGREGSLSNGVKKYIKIHHQEFDFIIMSGYSHLAEIKAIRFLNKHHIKYGQMINGGVIHSKEFFLKRIYKSNILSTANFYISPSQKSDEYLVYYHANKDRIYRYPYTNISQKDIDKREVNKEEIRKQFSLPLDKKIFICPGQFIKRKNNIQLINLFLERDDQLLLIGTGPEKDEYLKIIDGNHMKNVSIIPYMKKELLFEVMKACDCLITLSKEDIFGHTVLEGLSNGLPVISSDKVISSLEYIKDGYNGYIVSLDDEKSIHKAMDNIGAINKENTYASVQNNTFEACGKRIYEILESEENRKCQK